MSARNINKLSGREMDYLNSWLLRYGKVKVRKYQHIPQVILNTYLSDLVTFNKSFEGNSDDQRLRYINEYTDYILNVEPTYKRFLKLHSLKGYEIGGMLGYKNQNTWHTSYKRYTYIRAIVTLINKHEELLTKLNNPNL